ncbi:MAG TPA: nitroreductase family protein [Syntrophales bacterium]|nr:nitroreductase family protein [Syntrophales bacterium]
MRYSEPVTEIIKKRFSCRTCTHKPIAGEERGLLADFLSVCDAGPFGAAVRLELIAASEHDRRALKGLGTYGFIKGATAFIVGAVGTSEKNLEDFGYVMETAVLCATDIGLGTCWLGGSFTRSSFARKISAGEDEIVPAVVSLGYIAEKRKSGVTVRRLVGGHNRMPWENLFFLERFGIPLLPEEAGVYGVPLEMLRLAPSASNKQPWRIVKDGTAWHFYMQRTKGYGNSLTFKLLHIADLQRVDLGIAMSHFELTAVEIGLTGKWIVQEPEIEKPDRLCEYTVSWISYD